MSATPPVKSNLLAALATEDEVRLPFARMVKLAAPEFKYVTIEDAGEDVDRSVPKNIDRLLRSAAVSNAFKEAGFTKVFHEARPSDRPYMEDLQQNRMSVQDLSDKIRPADWQKNPADKHNAPVISALAQLGISIEPGAAPGPVEPRNGLQAQHRDLIDGYMRRAVPSATQDQRDSMAAFLNSTDARIAVRLDSKTQDHMNRLASLTFPPLPLELQSLFGADRRTDTLFMTGQSGQAMRTTLREIILADEFTLRRRESGPKVASFINENSGREKAVIILSGPDAQSKGELNPALNGPALHIGIYSSEAGYEQARMRTKTEPQSAIMARDAAASLPHLLYLLEEKKLFQTAATPDHLAAQLRASERTRNEKPVEPHLG